jgi:hypothetical protein
MKKVFFALVAVATLASCSNNTEATSTDSTSCDSCVVDSTTVDTLSGDTTVVAE